MKGQDVVNWLLIVAVAVVLILVTALRVEVRQAEQNQRKLDCAYELALFPNSVTPPGVCS